MVDGRWSVVGSRIANTVFGSGGAHKDCVVSVSVVVPIKLKPPANDAGAA